MCDCEVSGVYARLSIRIGFNDTRNVCTILMFIGKGRGTQATLYTFYIQTDGWNIFRIVSLCVRARSLYGFVLALSDKVFCFGRFALLLAGWLAAGVVVWCALHKSFFRWFLLRRRRRHQPSKQTAGVNHKLG